LTALAIVRATMILSTAAWAVGEALMRRSVRSDRLARGFWTGGIVLALLHVVLAFRFVYDWNHETAVAATVRQTTDLLGWGWRGGIYVNYAFLTWWLADVGWWWLAPESHATRSLRFERLRVAAFAFMFLNGAVVFASGIGRLVGTLSLILVLVSQAVSSPISWPPRSGGRRGPSWSSGWSRKPRDR
jgi:hypothetical protein